MKHVSPDAITPDAVVPQALAWRIVLSNSPIDATDTDDTFNGTARAWFQKIPMDLDETLNQSACDVGEHIDLIWIEAGADLEGDIEKRTEEWLAADDYLPRQLVRAGLRTIRVFWSGRRAAIFGPAETLADAQDAVIRFTLMAWKTCELEMEMRAIWPIVDSQLPLLSSSALSRKSLPPDFETVTDQVNRMNSAILKVDAVIGQMDPSLTVTSKRLFSELSAQAALDDRLELLGDPIDNAVEHFELVNGRLIEARTAASGHFLELLIVLLLVVEVGMWSYQIASQSGLVDRFAYVLESNQN